MLEDNERQLAGWNPFFFIETAMDKVIPAKNAPKEQRSAFYS